MHSLIGYLVVKLKGRFILVVFRKFLKALRDQQLLSKKEPKTEGSTLHQGIHQSVFMSAMVTSPSTKVSGVARLEHVHTERKLTMI